MEDEQYKRYRKMESEPIECLYTTYDKKKTLYFLITGSSDSKYKVTITKPGKISCSCPDFKNGCRHNECVCKHCLYVIYKVLEVFQDLEHEFFKRREFTKDEMKEVYKCYKLNRKKNVANK